jgi:hypothetical protein
VELELHRLEAFQSKGDHVPAVDVALMHPGAEGGQQGPGLIGVGGHHLHLDLVADGALGRPGDQHGQG